MEFKVRQVKREKITIKEVIIVTIIFLALIEMVALPVQLMNLIK